MCYTQWSTTGTLDSVRALLPRELLAVVLFILVKPLGLRQNGHGEEKKSRGLREMAGFLPFSLWDMFLLHFILAPWV